MFMMACQASSTRSSRKPDGIRIPRILAQRDLAPSRPAPGRMALAAVRAALRRKESCHGPFAPAACLGVVLWSLSLDALVLLLPSREADDAVFPLCESLAESLGFLRDVEDFRLLLPMVSCVDGWRFARLRTRR